MDRKADHRAIDFFARLYYFAKGMENLVFKGGRMES
jgi:hypothetical protein